MFRRKVLLTADTNGQILNYAAMGKFAVDRNEPGVEPYIPGSPRLNITLDGNSLLAAHCRLPDVPLEPVLDKSKADSIAKTLICVQAFWIIIQSIARVASHLPLTFLEINTVGHVICSLFVFLFWWDKPLEVLYPTLLAGDSMHDLCALMWSCTLGSRPNFDTLRRVGHAWEKGGPIYTPGEGQQKSTISNIMALQYMKSLGRNRTKTRRGLARSVRSKLLKSQPRHPTTFLLAQCLAPGTVAIGYDCEL